MDGATDPYAVEKLLGLMHRDTPFSPLLATVLEGCSDRLIEDCLEDRPQLRDHMSGIAGITESLEDGVGAGECYDGVLTADDVAEYVAALSPLFPSGDREAAEAAATAALGAGGEASFQASADRVLDALDAAMPLRLRCPGIGLSSNYGVECPP